MTVFQQRLMQNFDKAAIHYLDHAKIQRDPADKLIRQFKVIYESGLILDLGSGPGTFKHSGYGFQPNVINFDLSRNMLRTGHPDLVKICGDAASLPFKDNSFTTIVSNLMLQWPKDKATVLREVNRVLIPGGTFLFTTLVYPSLWQLKHTWRLFDQVEHSIPFYESNDYLEMVKLSNFEIICCQEWEDRHHFSDIYSLLKHFKLTGTSLPRASASQGLAGKETLQQLAENYPEYDINGQLILSYCYLLLVIRKHNE